MGRIFPVFLFFLLLTLLLSAGGTAASPFAAGEILVRFVFPPEEKGPVSLSSGARTMKRIRNLPLYRVPLHEGVTVAEGLRQYRGRTDVAYAEPNYLRYGTAVIPGDPLFDRQWGLHNTGQEVRGYYGTAGADIRAVEAWDRTTGSGAVIVAVMDSGIDGSHGDLSENIWRNPGEIPDNGIDDDGNGYIDDIRGWDFLDEDNDPADENGHGTHLAGIVGARGNNGLGIAGINWRVSLMALRFLDASGIGSVADEIEAMAYAMEAGAQVINASVGGTDASRAERDTIALLMERGILFVAAAGNEGADNDEIPNYPSAYDLPNILSVAATDQDDDRCIFSDYGALSVDGGAPGLFILSTLPGDTYGYLSGTSMATAFTSGLAGLLWSAFPLSTGQDILYRILYGTDFRFSLAGLVATGGRINAERALETVPPATPPGAPSNLSVQPVSDGEIALAWQDGSADELGFEIERKGEGETSFTRIAWTPLNALSFSDGLLAEAAEYAYRLRAFNPRGASSYSNEEKAVTLLRAPSELQASGLSATAIGLTWTDASVRESGFRVERKNGTTGVFDVIATVPADSEYFEDSGLSAGTTYTYRIQAFNDRTVSAFTAETEGSTPAGTGGGGGGGCFLSILTGP